jgi:hypothetical protein
MLLWSRSPSWVVVVVLTTVMRWWDQVTARGWSVWGKTSRACSSIRRNRACCIWWTTEVVDHDQQGCSVSPSNVMRGVIYARIGMDRGVAEAGVVAYIRTSK